MDRQECRAGHAVLEACPPRAPEGLGPRRKAEDLAERLHAFSGGARVSHDDAGRAVGVHPNALRYAAATGRVLIRWDGARQATVWTVPPPEMEPRDARLELARRYLHVFGPATPESFGGWVGIGARQGIAAFEALRAELTPVDTPIGEARILTEDEPTVRGSSRTVAAARLLPSGDTYFLLHGVDRELLLPDASHRGMLWTSRVWPGALLVDGEIVGTWRRAGGTVTAQTWRRLPPAAREAVEAEAAALPLPDLRGPIVVRWGD